MKENDAVADSGRKLLETEETQRNKNEEDISMFRIANHNDIDV